MHRLAEKCLNYYSKQFFRASLFSKKLSSVQRVSIFAPQNCLPPFESSLCRKQIILIWSSVNDQKRAFLRYLTGTCFSACSKIRLTFRYWAVKRRDSKLHDLQIKFFSRSQCGKYLSQLDDQK